MDMIGNLLASERKKKGLEIIDVEHTPARGLFEIEEWYSTADGRSYSSLRKDS